MWDDFQHSLDDLRHSGRHRTLHSYRHDGAYLIDQDQNRLVNFGSNDYLGLASNRELRDVSQSPNTADGQGATASALVCGWTERHQRLADELASLEATESAIVTPSGFAACSGTIATLARKGDLILSDQLNHASVIDGCRLSRAQTVVFPHRDANFVQQYLASHRSQFDRVWIVTDAVFSMDGHLAPLGRLCDVAESFQATVIADEAHGTGVLGETGSGACEALSVKARVPIRIGTLSKAIGSQGGFVVGPTVVIDYLVNHARPLIFSTALALPAVEKSLSSLACIRSDSSRRLRVQSLAKRLRQEMGIEQSAVESVIPIVPIHIGSDSDAVSASDGLQRLGLFVPAIRPPTVPEGQARLRVSLSASHSDGMLTDLIAGLRSI